MGPTPEKGSCPLRRPVFGFSEGSGGIHGCLSEGRARSACVFAEWHWDRSSWLIGRLLPCATPSPKCGVLFFFFLNSPVAVEGAWLDCGVVGVHWLIGCWKMYALLGSHWCDARKGSGLLTGQQMLLQVFRGLVSKRSKG